VRTNREKELNYPCMANNLWEYHQSLLGITTRGQSKAGT